MQKMSLTVEMVNVFMDLVSVMESINAEMELMNLGGKCVHWTWSRLMKYINRLVQPK